MSRPRAAIVATGSELVRGERQDRNGPFLAAAVVRLNGNKVELPQGTTFVVTSQRIVRAPS